MFKITFCLLVSLALALNQSDALFIRDPGSSLLKKNNIGDVNGGTGCAVCTILIGLTEQLAFVYNTTVEKTLNQVCKLLPAGIFQIACNEAVKEYGAVIIEGFLLKENSDVICHALRFCRTDKGQPECHIYPSSKVTIHARLDAFEAKLKQKSIDLPPVGFVPCKVAIFKPICDYINKIFNSHFPAVDLDSDGHSTQPTLRGTSWKGKDCNDLERNVHPGAKPSRSDIADDSNCNGIYGRNMTTFVAYEDKFCKNSQQLGVAVLGDSISAHFHIPEEWLDATQISRAAFENLAFILENELDWPELAAITGYMNTTWQVISGPTRSIYLNLLERNRCNFRDYQNVAVNGASTGGILEIAKSLARNPHNDQPMFVLLSLVGNDVCNGHPDTTNHMTKPKDFHDNLVKTLTYLDTVLPNGSHVLLTGLANGSLLFDSVGDRFHPFGRARNDVKYSDVYTYLSCLQISPCNGWMTVNATLRDFTTSYAVMLSGIVKNVSQSYKFKSFDMGYTDFPIMNAINKWKAKGGKAWELIEPVDGFHMNQIANALIADEYWNLISTNHPDWIGPINPYNQQIKDIFGNQGGY